MKRVRASARVINLPTLALTLTLYLYLPRCRNWYTYLPAGRRTTLIDRLYVFHPNPERRLLEHNLGKTRSTRQRRPFKIIYLESFSTRVLARAKEIYLKSGSGREFLKAI